MNLQRTILNECREEVTKSKRNHPIANSKFESFEEMQRQFEENGFGNMLILAEQESSELALDRISEFYRWANKSYSVMSDNTWHKGSDPISDPITELELYNIWREGK